MKDRRCSQCKWYGNGCCLAPVPLIGYDNADMCAGSYSLCRGTNPHRSANDCECLVQRCAPGCALCTAVDDEVEGLRLEQARAAATIAGPLLDAWDQLPNDTKGDPDLSGVAAEMVRLDAAMG